MNKSFDGRSHGLLIALLAAALILTGCEPLRFRQARKKNTEKAYQEFLAQYPDGKFAEAAWIYLDELAFRKAKRNGSLASMYEYLDQFPRGKYADDFKVLIRTLLAGKVKSLSPQDLAQVSIEFQTSMGNFTIKLRPDKAPGACRNMALLAASRFYEGLFINRVEANRAVYMGDPRGTGSGGPGYYIATEINDLPQKRAMVSMRSLPVDPNTVGSQFFVALTDLPEMDGKFTIFAEVVDGIEVLDAISQAPTNGPKTRLAFVPLNLISIKKVVMQGVDLESGIAPGALQLSDPESDPMEDEGQDLDDLDSPKPEADGNGP